MTEALTTVPRREFQSFHDFPICLDLDALDADIAIIGIPHGAAYTIDEVSNDQAKAPAPDDQAGEPARNQSNQQNDEQTFS